MTDGFEGDASYRLLAVDGRRTRTIAVLANGRGAILGIGVGRGATSDRSAESQSDAGDMDRALAESIEGARLDAGDPDLNQVLVARLSMAGGPTMAAQSVGRLIPYARIASETGAPAALASFTMGGPGVVVVAGIGSIAFGRCPKGREVSVGGWGFAMGDEGSGHWIALQALSAVTKAADGRAEATALTALLLRHWDAPNLTTLHQRISAGGFGRAALASGAERVGFAAREGDAVAGRILRSAGHELGNLAATALRRLSMEEEAFPVVASGGVFRAGEPLTGPFEEMLRQTAPRTSVARSRLPQVLGALALAFLDMELPVTPELIARMEEAAPRIRAMR